MAEKSLTQRLQEARALCAGLFSVAICSRVHPESLFPHHTYTGQIDDIGKRRAAGIVPCDDCLYLAKKMVQDAFAACELEIIKDQREELDKKARRREAYREAQGWS